MTKAKIIESILKTQVSAFRDIIRHELNFHDDIIEPAKGEREPAYTIIETGSRFIKKFNATEVDYTIKVKKKMEIENAINALLDHAKKKGNYKKGDKLTIVVSNPTFHHDISTVVQLEVKAVDFMNHIAKILSSNEDLDITQCRFNIKILNVPHGSKSNKIINLSNYIRTKKCITQIKSKDDLCCPRAIVTALTYHTNNIFGTQKNIKHIREGRKIQTKLTE
jgi:hypothetical protein